MLSRPNQTEPTRSKQDAKPDHPDPEKINNLSTEISTKGSFRIFGCCFKPDDPQQQSGFFSKMFLAHPTSAMASNKTKKSANLDIFDPPPLEIDPPVEYPVDKVFILGEAYKIVAKITVKKVLKQASILHQGSILNRRRANESVKGLGPSFRKSTMYHNERDRAISRTSRIDSTILEEDIPLEVKKEIFSQFEKGIKAEKWQEITPEKVAIHVADRLRCDVLIDALCGIGGNTIQFARTCNYVIGIDIQDLKTTWARHNARVYKIDHKIDFITGDFMRIRNITGDVVFLGPAYEHNPDEAFSIFKHVQPDPLTLLAKSLEVSYKIALQLPGDTQLEELPHLFNESLEKYGSYSKRFCIEIEKIVNSFNETECIMIYFGDCSSISIKEEYEAIYEYISRNEVPEWREEFPLQVVTAIVQKVGILRTFKFLSRIEAQYAEKDLVVISLFDAFLKKVIQENVLTKAYVEKLIEEADRKAEWANVNVNLHPNTYNSPIIPTFSHKKIELESHNKNSKNIEASPLKAAKPTGLLSRLVTGPGQGPVIEKSSANSNSVQKKGIGLMSSEEVSPTQFSVQEFQGTFKDSYEISDLPVSSYSVSSDYLMDFSEDEVQSRKMTEMNDSCRDIGGDFSGRNRDRNSVKSRFSRSPKYSDEERKQRMERKLKGEIDENRKSLQIPRRQSKDVFRSVTNRNEEIGSQKRLSFLLEGCDDF